MATGDRGGADSLAGEDSIPCWLLKPHIFCLKHFSLKCQIFVQCPYPYVLIVSVPNISH